MMIQFNKSHQSKYEQEKYLLRCLDCGKTYRDHFTLFCRTDVSLNPTNGNRCNSLLRSEYFADHVKVNGKRGLFKYACWLPIHETVEVASGPITYKSEALAKHLGLKNLYIGFSGYWPERKGNTLTCSFKEYEAFTNLYRLKEHNEKTLIVASSGNVARSFAYAATVLDVPVVIIIPESSLHRMWMTQVPSKKIKLICIKDGDYTDAIDLSKFMAKHYGYQIEGGSRNVGRRDGMGLVLVDGVQTMERLPDHYFQAIGSGTGAIAAWEAFERYIGDGRYGKKLPKLQLSQNLPFAPMYYAWKAGRREIIKSKDMPGARAQIKKMYTDTLSNRNPCFSITGGVYDALKTCGGDMWAIHNEEIKKVKRIFEELEGVDILPPAAVAVASLINAVEEDQVREEEYIFLNITGGGSKRLKKDKTIYNVEPIFTVDRKQSFQQINSLLK